MALIHLKNIHLAFGVAPILDGVHFSLEAGERVCLIGRNGEGKSTLLKLIDGKIKADSGEIIRRNPLKIAMLDQDVLQTSGTVFDIVMAGAGETADLLQEYNKMSADCANGDMKACETLANLQHKIEALGGWDLSRQVQTLLSVMQLDGSAQMSELSGGRKRRVLLARALASTPDVLLLDEPTNHLDVESIDWLEQFLLNWQGLTLLFISHDRSFIDKLATRIIELDRGKLSSFDVSTGIQGYARYQELKEQQLIAEEKANANFDKKLAEEEIWIRQGIKARRTRNEGRVRALKALREERKARRKQVGNASIQINDGEKSGKLVCQVEHLTLAYQDKILIKDFSTTILRGDKIGIIGKNGVGKSTLIHAILGLKPDGITQTGKIKLGTNLEIAFLDQLRNQLDPEASIAQNVAEGSDYIEIKGQKKHIIGYLQDFLFTPERARTPVKALSGGEKNRVLLAKQLLKPANILVLDEPTNDLDMATLELLEETLVNFDGTLLLISHDRTFMDNVVTSTWVFDPDQPAILQEYVGGYQDYLNQSQKNQKITQNKAPNKTSNQAQKTNEKTPHPTNDKKPTKTKLSYKEQRELDALPEQITQLENEQTQLQEKLADGSWFNTDLQGATQATKRLEEIETQLLTALERWEALETIKNA